MNLEECLHVTRHLDSHVKELRDGLFNKPIDYLEILVKARYKIVELEHDIIYIMRERKFAGYENIDFNVDLSIPESCKKYEFHKFEAENFAVALKVLAQLELFKQISSDLTPEDASAQLRILQNAIMDLSVAIALFKPYYKVNKNFDNFVV